MALPSGRGSCARRTLCVLRLQFVVRGARHERLGTEFSIGMRVCGVGLSHNDLNNRAGTLLGFLPEKGRWSVDFGNKVMVNVKPENLVTEEAFLADRAARDANRSATQRARIDRRRGCQAERSVRGLGALHAMWTKW